MSARDEEVGLSRGWDYIQQIANTLQDLEGAGSLAHELIQNADDAGAKRVTFRFAERALEISDDAGFRVCDDWRDDECGFEVDGQRPCDLHAFNRLGGGTKAADPDSTGAFGVGFLAVYQVTDMPEVLTSGLHLHIDEQERRTWVCPGNCDRRHVQKGTEILLPWASRQSALRRKLGAEPVSAGRRRQLLREFVDAVPTSMIFLRHVKETVVESKSESLAFKRSVRGPRLTIKGPDGPARWTLLEADFDEVAARLRQQHPRIESRHAQVRIAVPSEGRVEGRLFATLPTQVMTGLPVHIDASFYPRQDRKGIRLDGGFRTEWNLAAINAAADLLADHVEEVSRQLGPRPFWELIQGAYRLKSQASPETRALAPIWDALHEVLPEAQVMWTNNEEWEVVKGTALGPSTKERARLLEALGIPTVSKEIRRLVPWQPLKMRSVTLEQLVDGLGRAQAGHTGDGFPAAWRAAGQREALQKLLGELAPKPDADRSEDLDSSIADLEVWESVDGEPASFRSAYVAPPSTISAFRPIAQVPFVRWGARTHPNLAPMADHYTLETAVGDLDQADLDELDDTQLKRIVRWLDKKAKDFKEEDERLLDVLKALPIFSTAGGRASAEKSIRQGGFEDKLGLAGVIRETDLRGAKAIAAALGIRKLNFSDYLTQHVAPAAASGELDTKQCLELLRLCTKNVATVDRERQLRELLADLECVPCADGEVHAPSEAYFDYKPVRDVLGKDAPIAVEAIKPKSGVGDLLKRLGTAREPRAADVVARVELVTEQAPTRGRRKVISAVVDYLNRRPRAAASEEEFADLRQKSWLPAAGDDDRWYPPNSLLLGKDRRLCATSGTFVGLPTKQQQRCSATLVGLGINPEPAVGLVVEHLRNLSKDGMAPTPLVVRWLNERSTDEAIDGLRTVAFLPDMDGGLHRPDEIFRLDHPLVPRLPVLALKGTRPRQLLDALDVSDRPQACDAVDVLEGIACENAVEPSKETRRVITQAWRLISDDPQVNLDPIRDSQVVLGADRRLRRPSEALINDRPDVAKRLGVVAQGLLIDRDARIADGLLRAGVRPLSRCLRATVLRRSSGTRLRMAERHIMDRQEPLARAVRDGNGDLGVLFRLLSEIQVMSLSPLELRYSIEGHPEAAGAEPVKVSSHLAEDVLFLDTPDGRPNWSKVANSLRDKLMPAAGAGGALTIKAVLSAADAFEADAELNDAGCAPLTTEQLAELRAAIEQWEATKAEGDQEEDEFEASADDDEDVEVEDEYPDDDQETDTDDHRDEERNGSGEEAVSGSERGGDSFGGSDGEHGDRDGEGKSGGSGGSGGGRGDNSDRVLETRVYVSNSNEADPSTTDDGGNRSQMGEDGVDLVVTQLEAELAGSDLTVRKMPDKQKGYDVRVEDARGRVVRYIEVKSTDGSWGKRGVGLSGAQFALAQSEAERYWLYVVEYLYAHRARIWPIRNPAHLVNHYMYDRGWKELAGEGLAAPGATRR